MDGVSPLLVTEVKTWNYFQLLRTSTVQNWYDKQQLWGSDLVCPAVGRKAVKGKIECLVSVGI